MKKSSGITLWRRLGMYSTALLLLGTVILCACDGFLGYLWFADDGHWVWHKLAAAGWFTRTVTVVVLVVRTIATAQAAQAVSMVAAVWMERRVYLSDLPAVSIMRYSNRGPVAALGAAFRRAEGQYILGGTLLLLAVSSIVLQFSSTILLSDFRTLLALRVNETQTNGVALGADPNYMIQDAIIPAYWTFPPGGFPAFAEYDGRPLANTSETTVDTGITLRALLPISSQTTRSNMTDYFGTVYDMRVACVEPVLTNLSFHNGRLGDLANVTYLQGSVQYSARVPLMSPDATESPVAFGCVANQYLDISSIGFGTPSITVCNIQRPDVENGQNSHKFYSLGLTSPLSNNSVAGEAYLVFDHTNVTTGSFGPSETFTTAPNGIWTTIVADGGAAGPGTAGPMHVTMCFENRVSLNNTLPVVARSAGQRLEPEMGLQATSTTLFDTTAVRQQLAASNMRISLGDRGLLALALDSVDAESLVFTVNDQTQSAGNATDALSGGPAWAVADTALSLITQDAIVFCTECMQGARTSRTDPRQQAIFLDTLAETGNVALALQAFFTTLTRLVYYDLLPFFNVPSTLSVTMLKDVNVPARRYGFAVVTAAIACHLAIIWTCTALFAARSRHTVLNNAWQIFAEAAEVGGDRLVDHAGASTDWAVGKDLVRTGRAKEQWVLGDVAQSSAASGESERRVRLRRMPESVSQGYAVSSSISLEPLVPRIAHPDGPDKADDEE